MSHELFIYISYMVMRLPYIVEEIEVIYIEEYGSVRILPRKIVMKKITHILCIIDM